MRKNTSAVPPCLTENPPTSCRRRHARSPLTLALRRAILMEKAPLPRSARPRRSICRFAARGLSAMAPSSLCVRRRFDLRLNGFIQCITSGFPCQYWSCFSVVFTCLALIFSKHACILRFPPNFLQDVHRQRRAASLILFTESCVIRLHSHRRSRYHAESFAHSPC